MQRILSLLVVLPISILAVALAVANRRPVTVSLDPFSPDTPALAVSVPLFAVIFGALIVGVILGGAVAWFGQSRFRREAKQARKAQKRMAESQPSAGSALSLPAPRS